MSARYVCERCGTAFESSVARCPKCLRKSGVRATDDTPTDVARLARGDAAQSSAGRRSTMLGAAVALSAALGALVMLAWHWLDARGAALPPLVGWALASMAWVRAALLDREGERPWRAFVKRCAIGLGLGVWALVSAVISLVSTSDLSALFTAAVGVAIFFGGIIPVLRWMQQREEAKPKAGKWR